jgi:hypothetical protein
MTEAEQPNNLIRHVAAQRMKKPPATGVAGGFS